MMLSPLERIQMKMSTPAFRLAMYVLGLIALALFSTASQAQSQPRQEVGFASFYDSHGVTASGRVLSARSMTGAHRTLPFGTKVRVTNLMSKESVVVTINDRGPFVKGRVVDLAKLPATIIHLPKWGVAKVTMTILDGSNR
jgi:rare lipoprotein A